MLKGEIMPKHEDFVLQLGHGCDILKNHIFAKNGGETVHRIQVENKTFFAEDGELLSAVLQKNRLAVAHPCGGTGRCGKCRLLVDGKEELSCQYKITRDITVTLKKDGAVASPSGLSESLVPTEHMCYVLDIGTTTLALALVSLDEKRVVRVITRNNPQSAFGTDIMSRIAYCQTHSGTELHRLLATAIEEMIRELGVTESLVLFTAGNTAMLHLFLNEDCRGIGVAPYTPVFLEGRRVRSFLRGVWEIETLPSIHAFVGADAVAGMYRIGRPTSDKYRLLVDLGTNAEILLFSRESLLCSAAAAGPCFEGGCGIVCGMSATEGAICEVTQKQGWLTYKTVGDKAPVGICGTGLIDLVALLLRMGILDQTGALEDEIYPLTKEVSLHASDIRQLQLAKAAVSAAILSLLRIAEISFEDIEALYLAGGFSAKINVQNATTIGLLPKELTERAVFIGNGSLSGTVKYALEREDLSPLLRNARYIDLAQTKEFGDLFLQNIMFE